jgi:glutamate-1-semialdehyde 2,1-aminomutase
MKIIAVIQARMGSVRFPKKVMRPIMGIPTIELLLARLSKSRKIAQIVLATSDNPINLPLVDHVSKLGYAVYRGSEDDVLDRYYCAAKEHDPDAVIRITGDCPLIDAEVVDQVIALYEEPGVNYASNTMPPTFPNGLDTSIFDFSALEDAWENAKDPFEREHVTPYMKKNKKLIKRNLLWSEDCSLERWTIDEPEDFEVVNAIFENFNPDIYFCWQDIMTLHQQQPDIFKPNQHLIRNEGSILSTGQKMWKRANRSLMLSGNIVHEKQRIKSWPYYYSKSQGCMVIDLDGHSYVDMTMADSSCILGYAHPVVDNAVIQTINTGNNATLFCSEELLLAEQLLEMQPWAHKVSFTCSYNNALELAIRISRQYSGNRNIIRIYNGDYHEEIDDLMMFSYATIESIILKDNCKRVLTMIAQDDLAAIVFEISTECVIDTEVIIDIIQRAKEKNIVVIFDENFSGLRCADLGVHIELGIDPDIAIYGKSLANGYAVSALISDIKLKNVHEAHSKNRIDCPDRIGFAAALKTCEIIKNTTPYKTISNGEKRVFERICYLIQKHQLSIEIFRRSSVIYLFFNTVHAVSFKKLLTQRMLENGYIMGNSIRLCQMHTSLIIDGFIEELERVFVEISKFEKGEKAMDQLEKELD